MLLFCTFEVFLLREVFYLRLLRRIQEDFNHLSISITNFRILSTHKGKRQCFQQLNVVLIEALIFECVGFIFIYNVRIVNQIDNYFFVFLVYDGKLIHVFSCLRYNALFVYKGKYGDAAHRGKYVVDVVATGAVKPPELGPILPETSVLEVLLLIELICLDELLLGLRMPPFRCILCMTVTLAAFLSLVFRTRTFTPIFPTTLLGSS